MKLYLSADSSLQSYLREVRDTLVEKGVTVTSRWLDVPLENSNPGRYSETELHTAAENDLRDVRDCDVFVIFNPVSAQRQGTGGRHVEFGYAACLDIPCIYIGEKKENIFHRLSVVKVDLFMFATKPNVLANQIIAFADAIMKRESRVSER